MEKVILIGVNLKNNPDFEEEMEEMEQLVLACDMEISISSCQSLRTVNKNTCINSGKIEEISLLIDERDIETVVFNIDLTPSQQQALESIWKCNVMDRTYLILKIFEQRAKTKEAFLQVEVATLQYFLPRLKGSYTHMDRQRGGSRNKGTGEKKIEIDSRSISKNITRAKRELKKLESQREIQRSQRNKNDIKKVALVGYTNTGKSSIMNAIVEKQVFEKDMLFATLTTNTRKVELFNHHTFLLSDTVGFVSNLPHTLVEAFHSTLEEVKEADLLLHVMDSHSSQIDKQKSTTIQTLEEIGASDIPVLYVYNKCDLSHIDYPYTQNNSIYICAKDMKSIDCLLNKMDQLLFETVQMDIYIPYENGKMISNVNEYAQIHSQKHKENGIYYTIEFEKKYNKLFAQYKCQDS